MSKNVFIDSEKLVSKVVVSESISKITNILNQREKAIIDCFGVKAFKNKKIIYLEENNEEISYWYIEGVINAEDLQKILAIEEIVAIYDSGL